MTDFDRRLGWFLTFAGVVGLFGCLLWVDQGELVVAGSILIGGAGLLFARAQLGGVVDVCRPTQRAGLRALAALRHCRRAVGQLRPSVQAAKAGGIVFVLLVTVVGIQVAPVVGLFSDAADTDGIASAAAGDEEWTFTTGNNVYSSPTVVDGTVYVGSTDGNVYALDASSGSQQWSFTTGDKVRSSATVVDGTVYVASYDNTVYALDASDGTQQWSFTTGNDVWSSPTVADGTVYVGSNGGNVYALDASSGSQQWSYATGGGVWSSPTVVDGSVYVGSDDSNVYALDASDGTQQWSFTTGGKVRASTTVADGSVYVGSYDNSVYALDTADGSQQWKFTTGNEVELAGTVADGTVYVGSRDSNVYALDAADGSQQWSYTADSSVYAQPTVADGTVYTGSNDDNVYALEASGSGADSDGSRNLHGTLGHNSKFTADGSLGESVSGTITDADGDPITDATVEAVNTSTGSVESSTTTDSSGNYELSLEAGEYDIETTATLKETKTKTVDVSSGGETVDFTLRREKGSYTIKGADGTELTDRDVRIELYKVNNETKNNEPRYFLDETDQSPVATGSGSSISFDKAEYGENYVVAFRSDDGSKNQYRDLALPVAQVTGIYSLVLAPNTSVQQRVKIDDRTGGNWPSERVDIKAQNIDSGENRSRTALGSENLGTLWLNDSESYRIYAIRDDGAERRIGRLDAARETSDHPAVFDIRPPDDVFNRTDIQNRTAADVDPWNNESDIHYPPTAVADADDTSPVAGDSVTFDATDSEAYGDASISSYSWELPDGSTASGSTATWSSSSDNAGETATATVTVEDSEGVRDTTQVTLYIAEDAADAAVPPAADATLETDDPVAGEPVVLSEAADTADGVALESVEWDLDGDGSFEESGEKVEYTPGQSSLETVTIRVTDENGVTDERAISFFVGSDAESGLGIGGGGGGGVGGGPIGGGGSGPSGSQQIALGVAAAGGYALWRRSGGPGVVAGARRAAPMVKRAGSSALSAVGTLARGTGRAIRRLVGALT